MKTKKVDKKKTLAYAVACSTTLKRPYLETKKLCRRTITVMTAAVMAVAVLIVMAKLPDGGFAGQFKLDSGNQITQEQVDAFENGQISLLKEVDDALLQAYSFALSLNVIFHADLNGSVIV